MITFKIEPSLRRLVPHTKTVEIPKNLVLSMLPKKERPIKRKLPNSHIMKKKKMEINDNKHKNIINLAKDK